MSYTYYLRGTLYFWQLKYEQALIDLNRAIELRPGKTDYHITRAAIYFQLDNLITIKKIHT